MYASSPASFRMRTDSSALSPGTTTAMPTPILNVLNMSRSGILPTFCSSGKMGGMRRLFFSSFATQPAASARGMFS